MHIWAALRLAASRVFVLPHRSETLFLLARAQVGSDLVNITSKSPTWVNRCSFSGCQLNIAVYGYQAASFTAIATAQ